MQEVDFGVHTDDGLTTVCHSNDEAFAKIVRLYARTGQTLVDPTFGNGTFWKRIDCRLYQTLFSDLKDGTDLRSLPYPSDSADLLVLDPPYRYTPAKNVRHEDTPGHGRVDGLYNLQASRLTRTQDVLELYGAGMIEAVRVLRRGGFLVVKCQDTAQDGKNIWAHCLLITKAETLGISCRDIVIVTTASPTKTRREKRRHFRKAHSYFLIFRKGGHFPFGMPSVQKR